MTAIGSLTLMLHQEVRINWRMMTARMSHKAALWSLAGFLVVWHLLALPVPFLLAEMPPLPRLDMLAAMSGVGVFGLIMILPFALLGTVRLIYSRGDMDLLLSSPLPPHAIIVARVLAIAFGLFAMAGVFILPAANMGAFGNPRALLAYVALMCITLTATALGVLIAQGLFALLGARRTRLVAQIVGAMMVLATLCLVNLQNILSAAAMEALTQRITNLAAHVPAVESFVWWPARAALGEPLPFLVVTSLCVGLFLVTTYGLANRLIANAVAANGTAEKTVRMRSSSRALMSQRGPVAVTRRKEWLLIGRDPWLMTQIAQQLLFMVPTILIIWKASSLSYAWLCVVMLTGQLAGSLAWLTVSTEEAPDLLATAPVRRRDMLLAKLQAALVPTVVLMGVPFAVAWAVDVWLGFTITLCGFGCALTTALYHVCNPSTAKRSDLMWRGSNKSHGMIELVLVLAWVAPATLMILFGWLGLPALAVTVPIAYLLARPRAGKR
jgi:ABC-2 type transport system permease protein